MSSAKTPDLSPEQRPAANCRRRTRRLGLTIQVEVSGKDASNAPFTITAMVTNLNRHGAMLKLQRELSLNSVVLIKNGQGVRASARVVAQKSADALSAYGIEFVDDNNAKGFWGIIFPPLSQPRR